MSTSFRIWDDPEHEQRAKDEYAPLDNEKIQNINNWVSRMPEEKPSLHVDGWTVDVVHGILTRDQEAFLMSTKHLPALKLFGKRSWKRMENCARLQTLRFASPDSKSAKLTLSAYSRS